jgi:hypothetical protein
MGYDYSGGIRRSVSEGHTEVFLSISCPVIKSHMENDNAIQAGLLVTQMVQE